MGFNQRGYTRQDVADIELMIANGLNSSQIAEAMGNGCTATSIRGVCSRRGISLKSPVTNKAYTPELKAQVLARAKAIGVAGAAREAGVPEATAAVWQRKHREEEAAKVAGDTRERPWLGKAWRLVLASDGHYYIVPRGCDLPRGAVLVGRRRIGGSDISRPAYFEGELAAEYRITPVLPALIHSLAAELAGNNRAAADMLALELAAYDGTYPDTTQGVTKALKARHAMERAGFYLYVPTNPERAAVAAIVMRDLLRLAKSH